VSKVSSDKEMNQETGYLSITWIFFFT